MFFAGRRGVKRKQIDRSGNVILEGMNCGAANAEKFLATDEDGKVVFISAEDAFQRLMDRERE